MVNEQNEMNRKLGPIIVAAANAMRAFDAPVRYSLLITNKTYNPFGDLTNGLKTANFSSFIVMIEHFIGMLIIAPIIFFSRGIDHFIDKLKSFSREDWASLAFISMGSGMGLFFFLIALALGNPTVAVLLQKSQPLITLLVAMIVLKERPTWFYYLAAFFAMVGILLLSWEDLVNKELFEITAVICSLIAAALWGSNTVFGRVLTKKVDYWDLTVLRYIGGFLFLLVFNIVIFAYTPENFNQLSLTFITFGPLFGGSSVLAWNIPMTGLMCLIYVSIFTGGVLPLALYYFGLKMSKASVAGLAELAFPLLSVFINYIFLGFTLTSIQLVGAVILLSVVSFLSYVNAKEYESQERFREYEKIKNLS